MSNSAVDRKLELEELAINLEYSFERGLDRHNRVIRLTGDVEEGFFDWFDTAVTLLETENSRKTIVLKINSYGGDVYEALAIIGRMKECKCRIHTKGYGKIMSAATAILAAGDKRSMSKLAEFMHHEMSYGVEGRHSEILHEVKNSQKLSEKWCNLMYELTGIPSSYWSNKGIGTDFYMSPEKCMQLNIVDEIF